MNCRRRACAVLVAMALLALPTSRLQASGFGIENQGARALGMAGAYTAQASDPSAIFYNAAGVAFLKGKRLYLSGGFGSIGADFTGTGPYPPVGTLEKSVRQFTVLPSAYYTQQVSETLVLGIGFNAPFGYRTEWQNPDEFTGRYICLDCEIRSFALNPTVAFKVEDRLALGFGLDVRFSSLHLSRRLIADPNPFPEPTDVAELTIDSGTETGIGFNAGLLAKLSDSVSLGLAYRHRVNVDYGATGDFQQVPTGNDAVDDVVAANLPPRQPVLTQVSFPATWSGGIAIRRGDWTVEGDIVWWRWATFESVRFNFTETPALSRTLPQNYENTLQGRLGIEYIVNDSWEVRGGYSYDRSPQPIETTSPFLHDEDRHGFGVGGSWLSGNVRLDFLFRYLLYRERETLGESEYDYEGVYNTDSFQFGLALGYRF